MFEIFGTSIPLVFVIYAIWRAYDSYQQKKLDETIKIKTEAIKARTNNKELTQLSDTEWGKILREETDEEFRIYLTIFREGLENSKKPKNWLAKLEPVLSTIAYVVVALFMLISLLDIIGLINLTEIVENYFKN